MPKVGMRPIRRAQLIEATKACIYKYGFAGTTIVKVSQEADVSVGIISHYFGSKEALLEATMRDLLKHLGHYADDVKKSTDPKTRIVAIIDRNFASIQTTPRAATVWLAFWGKAPHVPSLARLQKVNLRRLQSNLRYWLKQLLPDSRAEKTADGLAAMIDGLWLRGAFEKDGINVDYAISICLDYLERQLNN